MKMNSIRWNIGFGMFVLMSVISSGLYLLLTLGPQTSAEDIFRNRFHNQAALIASSLNSGIEPADIQQLSGRLEKLVQGQDLSYAILASEYGVVSSYNRFPDKYDDLSQLTAIPGLSADGSIYRVSLPVESDSYLQLYTGFSTAPAMHLIARAKLRAALLSFAVFIVGLGGSMLISAWIVKPLNRLAEAAGSVTAGEATAIVEKIPDDEIGTVARSFNAMSHRVQELNDQLDEATEDMTLYATELDSLKKDRSRFESALKASEKRFRTIVENTNDVFLVMDGEWKVKWASASFKKLTGSSPSEITGASLSDIVDVDNADVFDTILATEIPPGSARIVEARCESASGEVKDIVVDVKDLRGASGIGGILLTITDISETKRTQRELLQAKETAEEMIRLKDSFLANMSHEIRTPLTGILGFAQVLMDETRGEKKQLATYIRDGGDRLLKTLNSFLDLAQLESNSINHNVERLDVVLETKNVVSHFVPEAHARNLELDIEAEADALYARVDRSIYVRILQNLLHNAFKFTKTGKIAVAIRSEPEWVCVDVADTGEGIAEDFLPSIFKEFTQESSGLTRSHEGAGLGLAITRRLLSLMGGSIDVESEKGQGTTFTFRLPTASRITHVASASGTDMAHAPTPEMPAVLLVEDNPDTQLLISRLIRDKYDVAVASSGQAAIDLVNNQHFRLIIMDINLGDGLNGVETLTEIRRQGMQDVPVIAVTAYALPGDRAKFLNNGFNDYLAKPFGRDDLLKVIKKNLLPASKAKAS